MSKNNYRIKSKTPVNKKTMKPHHKDY